MGQETSPLTRYNPVAESDLDPRLKNLLRYWNDKRGDRALPSRADIDPLELKQVLGNILLIGVVRSDAHERGRRFRCRLFGTGLVLYHGTALTGRCLAAIPNG